MPFDEQRTLRVRWNKREKWMIGYPSSAAGHIASDLLAGRTTLPTFLEELKEHGYDTTTLQLHVHRRRFLCLVSTGTFHCDHFYYLNGDMDGKYSLVDDHGHSHWFDKNASFYTFFSEEK
jgi:hypothetical protein